MCVVVSHFPYVSGRILRVPRLLSPMLLLRLCITVPDSLKSVQEALTCIQYVFDTNTRVRRGGKPADSSAACVKEMTAFLTHNEW